MSRPGPLVLTLAVFSACGGDPDGDARADTTPAPRASVAAEPSGDEPERIQPGTISSDVNETWPSVDPVDGSLWFSRYERNFNQQTILVAARDGDGWSTPTVATFSGSHGDRAPRFSPDGSTLYFTSDRPVEGGEGGEMHVWAVDRTADGWGEPRRLPSPVNGEGSYDAHPSPTNEAIYVASTRPGSAGRSDVFRIPVNGTGWGAAEAMPFNDALSQSDIVVAPDERWLVVVITDHPDGLGGDDLFVAERDGGGWGPLRHLPAPINSDEYEYGPSISPDGTMLYFTSHRGGSGDVYRIPVSALGIGSR